MTAISLPTGFRPQTCSLRLYTSQRVNAAPFGGSEQAVDLLNDRWLMSLRMAARTQAEAAAYEAWINSLRGQVNTSALWHFVRPVPRGTMRGTPTLSATAAQGASSIAITGGTASSTLLAGDMLGCGGLLLQVAADVTLNGSGAGTVSLVNRLRSALSSGASVTWNAPTAPFRLLSQSAITYLPGQAESFDLDFGEAI